MTATRFAEAFARVVSPGARARRTAFAMETNGSLG
jgi:hypothetical protein